MKLIVGLGNPGEKYINTRHNLGFMVVDEYAKKCLPSTDYGDFWKYEKKFKAEVGRLKSEDILLAKPQTYMNNSGMAVVAVAKYFKIQPEDIIIVYDELDLPLGKTRVRTGGGAAGHHGVESVIESLKTDQFQRVRLGIGPAKGSPEKFVLEPFMPSEKTKVKKMIQEAISAIDSMIISPLN